MGKAKNHTAPERAPHVQRCPEICRQQGTSFFSGNPSLYPQMPWMLSVLLLEPSNTDYLTAEASPSGTQHLSHVRKPMCRCRRFHVFTVVKGWTLVLDNHRNRAQSSSL